MPKRPQQRLQSAAAPVIRSGTNLLMRTDSETDARRAQEKREEQEWLLLRLDKIEALYQSKELRLFIAEVLDRKREDWTEQNVGDVAIVDKVYDLDREISLARVSIKAGDTWNNKHFRYAQQIKEDFDILWKLRKLQILREASGKAATTRKDLANQKLNEVRTAIEKRKHTYPNERYDRLRQFVLKECGLQKDTARRYLVSLGYLPPK